MTRVELINPTPGGRRFTSSSKAQDYVRLGRAVFEGPRLRFLPTGFQARLNAAEAELEFRRNRGEQVFWNGAEGHWKSKLPGTASVFRKQGQRPSR